MSSTDEWAEEKEFWGKHQNVRRFDIEETGTGYGGSYREMVPNGFGDWVRAEDFRAVVEALEKELRNVVP